MDDGQHDSISLKPVASLLEMLAHWLVGGWLVHAVPVLSKSLGHCPASLPHILLPILATGEQVNAVAVAVNKIKM